MAARVSGSGRRLSTNCTRNGGDGVAAMVNGSAKYTKIADNSYGRLVSAYMGQAFELGQAVQLHEGRILLFSSTIPSLFESIIRRPIIALLVCTYLPHSITKNKTSTFLRLRAASRSTVVPISWFMLERVRLLQMHRRVQVRAAATKVMQSGFMYQLLLCGGQRKGNRLLRMDPHTGIPFGMAWQYWEERQRKKMISGWSRDGDVLWL